MPTLNLSDSNQASWKLRRPTLANVDRKEMRCREGRVVALATGRKAGEPDPARGQDAWRSRSFLAVRTARLGPRCCPDAEFSPLTLGEAGHCSSSIS